MVFKSGKKTAFINGSGQRKCTSWIEAFVERTDALDAPVIFRRWAAILAISSVLEQKVWIKSGGSELYPNLYIFLVGHPGVGKTRVIRAMKQYLREIPEFHFAPTSMTAPSLVDALVEAKRDIIRMEKDEENLKYNASTITAEELTAFMHKYDDEMIGVLSAFYDPDPYIHTRRGKDIKIKIPRPQLNIISGTTPSNLMKFLPEFAWDQGFTSRVIMIYSDERIIGDDFIVKPVVVHEDLIYDLNLINAVVGEIKVDTSYHEAIKIWRDIGEPPIPNHPKLLHYITRRRVHLYKLSMVAALDRGGPLTLTVADFNKALGWLVDAESFMPTIFRAGQIGADAKAQDEIYNYMFTADRGSGVPEHKIVNFARHLIPSYAIKQCFEVMERSMLIRSIAYDKSIGQRIWKAMPKQDLMGMDLITNPSPNALETSASSAQLAAPATSQPTPEAPSGAHQSKPPFRRL